jgi:hypothetical protein
VESQDRTFHVATIMHNVITGVCNVIIRFFKHFIVTSAQANKIWCIDNKLVE